MQILTVKSITTKLQPIKPQRLATEQGLRGQISLGKGDRIDSYEWLVCVCVCVCGSVMGGPSYKSKGKGNGEGTE